jgi:RHS repeat-associated protein
VVDNNLSANNTTSYSYDPSSNVATVSYPNGLTSTFTYDTLNRLKELSTPPIADYKYTLGLTGLRTGATEQSGRTLQWNYDGIYRLNSETVASDPSNINGSVGYLLDPVGNRTATNSSLNGISSSSGIGYNADDELQPGEGETYDANGNTLTTGGKTFTYDAENHLLTMTQGTTSVSNVYDAFGNRVAKTVTAAGVTTTTQYLVEDDVNPTGYPQVVEELAGPIGAGTVTRQYTYGLQRISENQQIANVWTPSFYGYDGFGTVRQLTNLEAAVTDTYEYDAFGNVLNQTGSTPNNYLYRGEQYDSDLGLYYLRARYYNPNTGRFMSRDPEDGKASDPWSLHKYLYVGGDPVNWIDPRGRMFESAIIEGGSKATLVDAALDGLGMVLRKCYANIAMSIMYALMASKEPLAWIGTATYLGTCLVKFIPNPPPPPTPPPTPPPPEPPPPCNIIICGGGGKGPRP